MIESIPSKTLANLDVKKLTEYVKTKPCCTNYPDCIHANHQSDKLLHKDFLDVNESIDQAIKDFLGDVKVVDKYSWVYLTKAGEQVDSQRHNHNVPSSRICYSGIAYLTETNLGTVIVDGNIIKPIMNHWHIFNSSIFHHPEKGTVDKDRLVLAFDIHLEV